MSVRALMGIIVLMLACEAVSTQRSTSVVSGFSRTAVGIQRAAWLQGCWELTTPTRSVEEVWTSAKGGSMIGVSRTIQNGKMTSYELIVLREHGDRLAYEAHPSGQPAATFLSTQISLSELVFENPAHDFPQQVGYRLDGNALLAWIRGTQNGTDRRIEFPYTRARCGGV
jgi:hypothetical protein